MEQFSRGEISRTFYLREMGAISLKADRKAKRMVAVPEESEMPPNNVNLTVDSDSQDSLSETRPFAGNSGMPPRHVLPSHCFQVHKKYAQKG